MAIHNNVDPSFLVLSDINTLSIVIRNLLSNAIKFTNRNGVIEISSNNDSENSIIFISDNGVGIEPEDIVKLFDPSKSDSKPGTENEKGTGLGLMLCKELIEFNDGSISVKSNLGLGSSFIISLPKS
ncbi:MAG: ATP-binding protein [Bacteroidetes bacterium]|nr:ATP-binding protein [Bacteroidota bacterium]